MAKDKLITVRISNEIYDQFKAWTESNNSNISQCLREYILDCLNLNQSSQNIDSNIDNNLYRQLENEVKKLSSQVEQLEDSLYNRLYNSLVNGLSSQYIDSSIDNGSSSQNIDNSIDIINTGKVTAIAVEDVPEKPEALIQSDSETLPSENKLETEEIALDAITPKTKNKGNKSDSEMIFIELAKKHNLNVCDDSELKENLITFLSAYLDRNISSNNISKVASQHEHYPVDAIFWEYFQAEKVKNQWLWKRIKDF